MQKKRAEEFEVEADLVRLLRGGPVNALVLSEDECKAVYRLQSRGIVRRTFNNPLAVMGVWHVELVP